MILFLPRCIDDLQAANALYSSVCGLFLVYTSVRDQYEENILRTVFFSA